jgi:P-type Mg2+ transporter
MSVIKYSSWKAEDVFKELSAFPKGLDKSEAEKRIKDHGRNELVKQKIYWHNILLRQFKSSFIYLLFGAAILYFAMGHIIDGFLILLFVIINAALGFYQEYKSENSLKLLKEFITHQAIVIRNGKEEVIDSRLIVPGDIVRVEAGDIISADIRFFKENDLMVDESILTGESLPIKKITEELEKEAIEIYEAKNIGFSGTTVVSGMGEGVVLATGKNMAIGEIAQLTASTSRESSFEKGVGRISGFILRLMLLTLIFIFLANLFIKGSEADPGSLIVFSLALAVSVIPEALPIVITFSLSSGAMRLAKNKVVAKRLSAIEDLGSIEVLCTDKTGTLTENELTIADILGDDKEQVAFTASLAFSIMEKKLKQPNNAFDLALFKKLTDKEKKELNNHKRINEIPFDPARRRNSVLVEKDNKRKLIVKGAFESIICFSKNIDVNRKREIIDWSSKEGKMGRRVIAVAEKEILNANEDYEIAEEEKDLNLIGLISFIDPLKKTTKAAINKARALGVKVKIITGDSPFVAGAVGYEIGLASSPEMVITGEDLEKMNHKKQLEAVEKYFVFARVSPKQKYNIIQLLQETNEVGFLGEGINDAPALRVASVGLAVQGAADIARDAADIILLKKDLKIIIDGIKEGRRTFVNTVKYIKATLASNFGNFYAVAISSLFIGFLPMLPLQILLLNLLSDFPMIAIATDNISEEELKKPKSYDIKEIALLATILGIVSSVFDFIIFGLFYKISPEVLQTNWFMASILTELVFIFSLRTKKLFFKGERPSGAMIYLTILAMITTIAIPFTKFGQDVFQFVRPSGDHLTIIFTVVTIYFIVTEIVKLMYYKYENNKI